MNILFKIFIIFAKLGTFSFGGGYVMIPIMLKEIQQNGFTDVSKLTDIVAIAGMSPGPVAFNSAIGVGHEIASLGGAAAAVLGILIPNFIIVATAAKFFFLIHRKKPVEAAFYGLRPSVTGIILFAAINLALKNGIVCAKPDNFIENGYGLIVGGMQIFEIKSLVIFTVSFILLVKTKLHPLSIIVTSGVLGILIF
jgi:chromate transporter